MHSCARTVHHSAPGTNIPPSLCACASNAEHLTVGRTQLSLLRPPFFEAPPLDYIARPPASTLDCPRPMPRPFGRDQDGRAPPAAPAAGFLQALQLRMRHALGADPTGLQADATRPVAGEPRCPPAASLGGRAVALPCLLETWRRRIDGMDKDAPNETDRTHQRHHRHHRHHHNHNHHNQHNHRLPRCHRRREPADDEAALSPPEPGDRPVAVEVAVGPPPPPCLLRELPKLLHPRLERQRACASLAGLWGSSPPPSPPPESEELRRGSPAWRSRCHPYCRRGPTGGKP